MAIRMMLALASVAVAAMTVAAVQKSSGGNQLSGTSWQLVKFQNSDEQTFQPDDKSKYTITFGRNGRVTVRVDCNRGNSTWKIATNGELQFGSGRGRVRSVVLDRFTIRSSQKAPTSTTSKSKMDACSYQECRAAVTTNSSHFQEDRNVDQ